MNISITTTYTLVWRYSESDYYFTKCGKCFNIKRSKELRRILNSGSSGYSINGKFMSLKSIRDKLKKIPISETPF